jgi:hypothetical protein
MDRQPLRFQLELERDRHPIDGRLTDEHGNTIPFTGWLELMALLEKGYAAAPRTSSAVSSQPNG